MYKSKTHLFCKSAFQPFKSSKVIDFCTKRKRVCDFLLVRHSNLDPTGQSCTVLEVL